MPADDPGARSADPQSLARAIAAGSAEAEHALLAHFLPGVRLLVRHLCRRSDPQIEDLCQDILLRLLTRLRDRTQEPLDSVASYLQTMIRHQCAEHYRRALTELDRDHLAPVPPTVREPQAQLESQQQQQRLHKLLQALPHARDRDVLRLYYLEEHSPAEVCRRLGIDHAHFRKVTHRARQRMREVLAEERQRSVH